MTTLDYTILITMGVLAVLAVGSFSIIARYLFDRGVVDRDRPTPDVRHFYKKYIEHTRADSGRIGIAFWIHSVSAAIFILTGVIYTLFRFAFPLLA